MLKGVLKTNGADLQYVQHTQTGRPIILIHGGPGLVGYTDSLAKLVLGCGQVIEYCQRGTFESPGRGPHTMATHVKDLHHLVHFFSKEQKPILVGHSWGAVLALLYAAKHKTSAHGIVVIGTGPLDISVASKMNINIGRRLEKKDKQKMTALKKQIVVEKDEKNKALLDLAFLKLVLPHYNVSHRSLSCLQLGLRNTKTVDKCSADYTEKLTKGSLVRCLKKISLPVTGIYGYCDPIPVPLNTSLLKKNIPQYTDIIIKNAGHFPWLEPKARQVFLRKLKMVLRHM